MNTSIIGNPMLPLSHGRKSETFLRVLEQSMLGCVERLGYHVNRYHSISTISIDDIRFDSSSAIDHQNNIGGKKPEGSKKDDRYQEFESAPQHHKLTRRVTAE
jgi:hypothetical protein